MLIYRSIKCRYSSCKKEKKHSINYGESLCCVKDKNVNMKHNVN